MTQSPDMIDVYLEIGKKRAFAGAVGWPGWCRSGRDQAAALRALFDSGPRYARILAAAQITFQAPADLSALVIVEQLAGNATTDFGAPNVMLSTDTAALDDAELQRLAALLHAYWQAFDTAIRAATDRELRRGPRGGGRDLDAIVRHVLEGDRSDLGRLAWKPARPEGQSLAEELAQTRQEVLQALTAAVRDGLPPRGPRGGAIWPPRYFVRRLAWHVLDHVWEIDERIT